MSSIWSLSMNELNVKNWLLQDYISYWNQWSLKHFGAFSFVILNYFKKKTLCLFHITKNWFSMDLILFALIVLYLHEKLVWQANVFHISPAKLCKFCTHKHDFQLKHSIYFVLAYIHPKQLEEHQIHKSGATLVAL